MKSSVGGERVMEKFTFQTVVEKITGFPKQQAIVSVIQLATKKILVATQYSIYIIEIDSSIREVQFKIAEDKR